VWRQARSSFHPSGGCGAAGWKSPQCLQLEIPKAPAAGSPPPPGDQGGRAAEEASITALQSFPTPGHRAASRACQHRHRPSPGEAGAWAAFDASGLQNQYSSTCLNWLQADAVRSERVCTAVGIPSFARSSGCKAAVFERQLFGRDQLRRWLERGDRAPRRVRASAQRSVRRRSSKAFFGGISASWPAAIRPLACSPGSGHHLPVAARPCRSKHQADQRRAPGEAALAQQG